MLKSNQFKSVSIQTILSKLMYSFLAVMITMLSVVNNTTAQQNGDVVILKSRYPSKNFIKLKNNQVKGGDIANDLKNGLWFYEEVPNTSYFRLRKAGTDKQYLNAVKGKLVCKFVTPSAQSSHWKRTKTDKFGYYRVQNRYNKTVFINSKGGTLKASAVTADSHSSHWTFKNKDKQGKKYVYDSGKKAQKPTTVPINQPKPKTVDIPVPSESVPSMPQKILPNVISVDNNHDEVLTHYKPRSSTNRSVQFSFSVNRNITWWKGIKVFDKNGNMVCMLSTQDSDHGPKYSKKFSLSQFGSKIKVEYWKAKAFGAHTHVGTDYIDLSTISKYDIGFGWKND